MTDIKISLDSTKMQEAGMHFGHRVSRLHPKMKSYVSGVKSNVHIIDMEKSAEAFEKALRFMVGLISEGKTVLFVGTKIQMRDMVKKAAQDCNLPYVTGRWLGGTITNFETISKRVQYFKDLEKRKATGDFEKYTKKEVAKMDKELTLLKNKLEGIKDLARLPEAVFIFDIKKDLTCAKEAKKKGIKIIGVVDTNIDPTIVNYPIPANDDAVSSIAYILDKVKESIIGLKSFNTK